MQLDNTVMIPPEIEQHLAPETIKTARCMAVVPWGNAGCQFEIHAGGADVEVHIDNTGKIIGVTYQLANIGDSSSAIETKEKP